MFVLKVIQALDAFKVDYGLAGGLAVSLHGALRGTIDVDLVIRLTREDFTKAEAALRSIGLEPRLPLRPEELFDFREEYIKNKNLIAWSFANPRDPSEIVDILIPYDLSKMKKKPVSVRGKKIKLLSIEDLIEMKEQSDRPQDREDIKSLLQLRG